MGTLKAIFLLILIFGLSGMAKADDEFIFSILKDRVEISSGFHGASIVVYGVKPAADNIALVLKGPETRVLVREKNKVLGLWMDTAGVTFRSVPAVYDVATSFTEVTAETKEVLRKENIGLDALVFEASQRRTPEEIAKFQEAFIRKSQEQERYTSQPRTIETTKDRLFKIKFMLPASVPEGLYTVEGYLIREGAVVTKDAQHFDVKPVGFAAEVRNFAHHYSFFYACLLVLVAFVAGLLAKIFAGARLKLEK